MAIAPFEEAGERRTGRPGQLRLIDGGRGEGAPPRGAALHARSDDAEARRRSRAAHPTAQVPAVRRAAPLVTARPPAAAIRAQTLSRRRRTAVVALVLVAVALLALPLRGLGAITVDGRATPGGVPAGLAPGSRYVVQPGETLASIARMVNPAAATTIAHELFVSTGSSTVVPGERVTIP